MKISIIVLTYNSESTILETLKSIEKQTYKNFEVIISDDCSCDRTIDICQSWQQENKNLKVLILTATKNKGVTANFNKALKKAKGKWIKAIAGDDLLLDICLEKNMKYVKKNKNIQILYSNAQLFCQNSNLEILPIKERNYNINNLTAQAQARELLINYFVITPTVFIKKNLIEKNRYYDERIPMIEDYPFWLKITRNGTKIYYFDCLTVKYRKEESLSLTTKNIVNLKFLNSLKLVYKYYIKDQENLFYKWHFIIEIYLLELIVKIFKNKKSNITNFLIKYKRILSPVFIVWRVKNKFLYEKFLKSEKGNGRNRKKNSKRN